MPGDERAAKGGQRKCFDWLVFCREIGWAKEDLDFLQALWWKHHNVDGNLINEAKP